MQKDQRIARWNRCKRYLRSCGSLPIAQAYAEREGFRAPLSAWMTALGQILREETREPEVTRS